MYFKDYVIKSFKKISTLVPPPPDTIKTLSNFCLTAFFKDNLFHGELNNLNMIWDLVRFLMEIPPGATLLERKRMRKEV